MARAGVILKGPVKLIF
ncbi:unnamed protein product [Victoria cruziana]